MKKIGVILLGVLFVLGLILSLCLYFPGYKQRVKWNDDFIETACTVASYSVEKDRCSYSCNCETVCGFDHNQNQNVCRDECDTCYRDCYKAYYNSNYTVLENGSRNGNGNRNANEHQIVLSVRMFLDSYTSSSKAKGGLNSQKPIGSTFLCYYHSGQPNEVQTTEYNEHRFFVSAIFFFVLTSIFGFAFCFAGMSFYKLVIIQWINDIRNPETGSGNT